jgi:uncharacterized membrane protein (DUF485 family)
MNTIRKLKLDLVFGLGWLISFIGGCSAKLIYEVNNEPIWLNSVVVGIFIGLGICFASLMVITSVFIYKSRIDSFDKKARAILSLLITIPLFFVGLFVIWRALVNISELVSLS